MSKINYKIDSDCYIAAVAEETNSEFFTMIIAKTLRGALMKSQFNLHTQSQLLKHNQYVVMYLYE